MTQVQLFEHPDFGSLTTMIDNEGNEFYKVKDVCIALRLANPSQQLKRHVKDKWVFKFDDGLSNSGEALYVSEPGLYALIFRSKTLQAQNFQDWVFEDVLPKLRANGVVMTANVTSEAVVKEWQLQGKEIEELKIEIGKLQREVKYYNAEYGSADNSNFKIRRQRLINEECASFLMNHPNQYRAIKMKVDLEIAQGQYLPGLIPFDQADYYASLRKKK